MTPPAGDRGTGADGFPTPPKGSPGGIRAAARSLKAAQRELEQADTGLSGATGALDADWQGDAAAQYRGASQGLGAAARQAAQLLGRSVGAVDGYADALEQAQTELKKLKKAYDDAKAREATAAGDAQRLAGQLLTADPMAVSGLETDIASASGNARAAGGDATRIAGSARRVMDEFEREERKANKELTALAGTVDGGNTGFGATINNGDLGYANGEIPSSSIRGFDKYMKSDWHNQNLSSPDDLTNVILLAAGAAGKPLAAGARRLASGLAEGLGLTGGRAAVDAAATQAEREAAAILRPGTSSRRAAAIKAAGRNAGVKKQVEVDARQGAGLKNVADLAGKSGVPVPPGTADVLGHLAEYQGVYRYYAIGKLLRLQTALEARGTRIAIRGAEAISRAIGALAR